MAELAALAGVPVILNPAPASALAAMSTTAQRSLLRHLTYLTPNENESDGKLMACSTFYNLMRHALSTQTLGRLIWLVAAGVTLVRETQAIGLRP